MTDSKSLIVKLSLAICPSNAFSQGYEQIFSRGTFLSMNLLVKTGKCVLRRESETKKRNKQAFQIQVIEEHYKSSE